MDEAEGVDLLAEMAAVAEMEEGFNEAIGRGEPMSSNPLAAAVERPRPVGQIATRAANAVVEKAGPMKRPAAAVGWGGRLKSLSAPTELGDSPKRVRVVASIDISP